jgi:hypothetical protein
MISTSTSWSNPSPLGPAPRPVARWPERSAAFGLTAALLGLDRLHACGVRREDQFAGLVHVGLTDDVAAGAALAGLLEHLARLGLDLARQALEDRAANAVTHLRDLLAVQPEDRLVVVVAELFFTAGTSTAATGAWCSPPSPTTASSVEERDDGPRHPHLRESSDRAGRIQTQGGFT